MEEWRDVPGLEWYQASNFGRIRSLDHYTIDSIGRNQFHRGTIMKQRTDKDGYKTVPIKKTTLRVHRLVAMAFIPNPDNLPLINHKDENPGNNFVENLEWCNEKYNVNYGTGLERTRLHTDYKAIEDKNRKPVYQLLLDGTEYCYWFSIKDASNYLGIDGTSIVHYLKGDRKMNSAGGYKWKYAE